MEKHGSGTLSLATSLDLYRELRAVTQDQLRSGYTISSRRTLLGARERATAQETAAGIWQVALDVRARKVVVDETGVEVVVPMDDLVQAGVSARRREGEKSDKPRYLR